ncbi:MAG: flagellar biosynthesis protein FliQ [Thermodesulfobacteriota bacterium]
MTPELVVTLCQEAIKTLLYISLPLMGIALVVGLAVSLFQAVKQLQEMTLTFIPKILAVFVVLLVLFPWMLNMMVDFSRNLFLNIPAMIVG